VFYTLRFGDIAPDAEAPAAGSPGRENRYLFIMVNFDERSAKTPGLALEGKTRAEALRARFAPWYYVITADAFAKLRPRRADLFQPAAARPSSAGR
jgi:hypothetical protein